MTKHTKREDLMAGAVAIETKDASANLSPELKALLDQFGTVANDVKQANEERIKGFEKKFADVVTEEKLAKALEGLDSLREEFNKQFAEIKRGPRGGDDGDYEDDIDAKVWNLRHMERKAFAGYVRNGNIEAMQAAQKLAQNDEYKSLAKQLGDALGIEIKDLSTVIAEDGGYLVQPEYEQEMDEILLETSPMRQVANIRSIGAPELVIPVNRKGTTVAWIGEKATRARTETPNITQERFRAHNIYALPLVTLDMLEDAQFDVEGWLNDEVVEALMIEENTRFVNGDGDGKPLGFLHSTVGKVAASSYDANTNWGSVAYIATGTSGDFGPSTPGSSVGPTTASNGADKLFDLAYELKPRYRQNATWLMSRRSMGRCRTLKDGNGAYVIRDAITESGLVPVLLGYPVLEAEDMPEFAADVYPIALGDWEKAYQIVDRVGLQVRRDETSIPGFVQFHFRKRTGGGPRNYDAYKLLKTSAS